MLIMVACYHINIHQNMKLKMNDYFRVPNNWRPHKDNMHRPCDYFAMMSSRAELKISVMFYIKSVRNCYGIEWGILFSLQRLSSILCKYNNWHNFE